MVEEVVLKTIVVTLKRVAVTEDDHGVCMTLSFRPEHIE